MVIIHASRVIRRLPLSPPKQPLFAFSTITPPSKLNSCILNFSYIFRQCSHPTALNLGKQGHAHMLVSGFNPTIFVSNCLLSMYIKCSCLIYAHNVFDVMTKRDIVSYNAMISAYAGCGEMGVAAELFDRMPERDVVSWNSMISGFLKNAEYRMLVVYFLEMGKIGVGFDRATFGIVLKACAVLVDYWLGVQVHALSVQSGVDKDVITGTALIDMYAKCARLDDSLCIFRELPEKNLVSWSAIVAGCVHNGVYNEGLELFKDMQKVGIGVSQSIYASLFRSCAGLCALQLGIQLHGHALKSNFGLDVIVGTSMLDMYAKCGFMEVSQKLFNLLPKRSLQAYNAIIVGYAQCDRGLDSFQLFQLLLRSGLGFDEISLSGAFSACAVIKGDLKGCQLHGLAIKSGFRSNICVSNAILDMYGKCGVVTKASLMFDELERKDAVSWNTIIAAHEQNGNEEATLQCFVSMLHSSMEPDEFTYGSVLKACASQQALNSGMEIHARILKSGMGLNLFVGGSLVDMYCKCRMMEQAKKIHNRIEQKTLLSCNAIISGFSLQKQSEDAQNFFLWMLEKGILPDKFTYAAVLDACADLATIGLGKQIHAQIIKLELLSDVYICSTLVDMYTKCGNVQDSRLLFEKASRRDFVTYNVMICGYAQHGHGVEALKLFEKMQLENIKPNHATLLSVLRACVHMGLVDKGLHYFDTMLSDYGLDPQLEHYCCIVDLIGRSGGIHEALKIINEMPFEADAFTWKTLLSICKIHGNVEIAEKAAASVLKLDPEDSSIYILLSNIYADAGMWDKVSEIRKIMRYNNLKKAPGCSWIEVKDELHAFLIGDKAHPQCEEIYKELGVLFAEMKGDGYILQVDFFASAWGI